MPEKFQTGLVLWLQFDEKAGNIAYDQSGFGNNGTIYGATFVNSPFLYALSFDGVDDKVDLGNVLNMGTGEFSISCWAKSFETGATKGFLGKKESVSAVASKGYGLGLVSAGTKWGFRVGDGTYGVSAEGSLVVKGEWVFLVGTFDSTKTARLYVNGNLAGSMRNANIGSIDTTATFKVGAMESYWNGIIDEVMVFNRVLSAQEIRALYLKGLKTHSTLKIKYK